MDHTILHELVQYLLERNFRSKKEMAEAIAVPYRTLLRAYDVSIGASCAKAVTAHILRYCIKNQILLDQAIMHF